MAWLAALLLAVPLTGAVLLWPRRRVVVTEAPPAAPAPAAPPAVVQLAPVAPVGSPDANGNYWPNQERHAQEALEAMRDANAKAMPNKRGGRGVMGGGISEEEQRRRDHEWIERQREKESGRGYGGRTGD